MTAYVSCAPGALYPADGSVDLPAEIAALRAAGDGAEVLREIYPSWRYRWPLPETLRLRGAA